MTLTELKDAVAVETKRPDKTALIAAKVKEATLSCHIYDFWDKDLFETGILFSTAEYLQRFMYKSAIPRWRALKYIRRVDTTTLEPYGPALRLIKPEAFMDEYQVEHENVCYESGLSLQIRTIDKCRRFLVGCYIFPDLADDTFSSWIAADYPYAIVYRAAASIFEDIGYQEQGRSATARANEQLGLIRTNNLLANGY